MNLSLYPSVSVLANELPVNSPEAIIKKISGYIEEFNQKGILDPKHKKLIFVLGNSGTGKSTLVNHLAGDDLVAKMVLGKLVIDNKTPSTVEIGHGSESKTFFPNFKKVGNSVYCDMPGFNDTRSVIEEIATAVFMKKVADYVSEIKILVAIAYFDIDARAEGLRSLVKSLLTFIPKIEAFNDGIDIIFTKVDNKLVMKGNTPTFITDEEIVQKISDTLNNFIEFNKEASFFQSIIHQGRIKIFRKPLELDDPSKEIRLKDVEIPGLGKIFENEKKSIKDTIKSTSYLNKSNITFGYSITSNAQLDSIGIARELKIEMASNISAIFEQIQRYYLTRIKNTIDIYELEEQLNPQNWHKEQFNLSDPIFFLQYIDKKINKFSINIGKTNFKEFSVKNEFLDFLQLLSVQITKYNNYEALDSLFNFLDKKKEFNRTLIDLININLNDESIINNLDKLKNNRDEESISKIVKNFVDFSEEQKSEINKLLDFMLKPPESKDNGDQRIVIGHIVKFSEVLELIKDKNIESLCIYSSKAVIMDNKSLELQSKNVSIIAPEWYMFGENIITLDGIDAETHDIPQAANGKNDGERGTDGHPGKSGHSAGNFLGISNTLYNSSALKISSIGGRGGLGQDGGNGHNGNDGKDADPYENKSKVVSFEGTDKYKPISGSPFGGERKERESGWGSITDYTYQDYKNEGVSGHPGGDGGAGGKAGLGGKRGIIEIFNEGNQGIFAISKDGDNGQNGKPGQGGIGGKNGQDAYTTFYISTNSRSLGSSSCGLQDSRMSGDKGRERNGASPSNPASEEGVQEQKIEMTWYKPFIEYRKFMAKNIENKFFKHSTEEFLNTLNKIQGRLNNH